MPLLRKFGNHDRLDLDASKGSRRAAPRRGAAASLVIALGLAQVVAGCASSGGSPVSDPAFAAREELLFESEGNISTVEKSETLEIRDPDTTPRTTNSAPSSTARPSPSEGDSNFEAGDEDEDIGVASNTMRHPLLPRDLPEPPGSNEVVDQEPHFENDDQPSVDEDSLFETGEIDAGKTALDIDSTRSPEEIGSLMRDASAAIEDAFALCEGSVYMEEWSRNFDKRWLAENGRNYKRRSALVRAQGEARSREFLKLLFPALGKMDFDYPVVITDDVIKWMQYFQTRGRRYFVTWLRRAEDIMPKVVPVLEAHGLPKDLVYLSMIESGFNNRALSIARAAGPWQFMRATGKMYGLTINDFVDERRDPAKSTVAAAQYLTSLYAMFGDWHLAAASYNAGEGRVMRAVRGLESQDFFTASEARRLPNETRNYVPKLIAAMIISKNPEKFGFEVASGSRAPRTRKLRLEKSVSLAELASSIDIDRSVLENLNPELRVGITPPSSLAEGGVYELFVPEAAYEQALAAVDTLPEASRSTRVAAKVRANESLANFARRNGIRVATLQSANPGLKASTRLRRGQTVMVPVTLGSGAYEKLTADSSKKKKKKFTASKKKSRVKYVSAKKSGTRKVKSVKNSTKLR